MKKNFFFRLGFHFHDISFIIHILFKTNLKSKTLLSETVQIRDAQPVCISSQFYFIGNFSVFKTDSSAQIQGKYIVVSI